MKTKNDAIKACLTFPDVYEDYPFGDTEWAVMRHNENKKSFALIFIKDGFVNINVKADEAGAFWRDVFPAVRPAYHMNKEHWVGIVLDGSMDDGQILTLISESYDRTKPKLKNKK